MVTSNGRKTKAELLDENRQLLQVIERHQWCIDELKRQRDELTTAIGRLAGLMDEPLEELPNGDFRDHAEELSNSVLLQEA